MTELTVTHAEVEELRQTVQDLADFPDMVTGFFVVYHTTEDRLMSLCRTTNPSETIGDIYRCLNYFLKNIQDFEPGDADGDDG